MRRRRTCDDETDANAYVTETTYAAYGAVTRGHELFARGLFARPRWLDGRKWLFWQFDDGGRLDGVDGAVDLDAFCGSPAQLRELAGGHADDYDRGPTKRDFVGDAARDGGR